MTSLSLSIVICTRNRAPKLRRCLHVLRAALGLRTDCEVLVCDNGSRDETVQLVCDLAVRDSRFQLIQQPEPGVSRAFNAAICQARGAVIGCIDDDCYVTPTYVDDLLRVFAHPEIDYCGGRILLFDPRHARMTIQESTERREFAPYSILIPGCIQGANMAYRRSVIEQVGGYCEQFGPGGAFSGNDIEFVARASLAGRRGAYEPSVVVHHDHGRDESAAQLRLGEYQRGYGAYYMRTLIDEGGAVILAKRVYWKVLVMCSISSLRKMSHMWAGAAAYLWMRLFRPSQLTVPQVARTASDAGSMDSVRSGLAS